MGINYLMVLIGGAMGAVCRYAVSIQMKRILSSEFPLATFLINLTGSFLLGMLLASNAGSVMRLLLGTGFLGGFTTFSTFQVENVALMRKGSVGTMLLYATLSVGLSVSFAFLGFALGG
jgi:fluoride exporter